MDLPASDAAGPIDVIVTALSGRSQTFSVLPDSSLQRFRKEVAQAFGCKFGSVKLIMDSKPLSFVHGAAKLRELSIRAGSELMLVQEYLMDVVEGARVRICDAGSDFVNGTYIAIADRRGRLYGANYGTVSFRRVGEEHLDIHEISTSISWYGMGFADESDYAGWPAAWYLEKGTGGSLYGPRVYFMESDDPSSLVLSGWQVYRAASYCESGEEPAPSIEPVCEESSVSN